MIPQYRTLKSNLPKYRLKKSFIPQYRKPPFPPPCWWRGDRKFGLRTSTLYLMFTIFVNIVIATSFHLSMLVCWKTCAGISKYRINLEYMEYMEYCKIRIIRNTLKHGIYRIFCIWFDLDWQKSRGKEYSVVLRYERNNFRTAVSHTRDLMTVLKAILTGEGSCITGI